MLHLLLYARQGCFQDLRNDKQSIIKMGESQMLGILISAGVLGLIITLMEEGEFPGWVPMTLCVLAALIPIVIFNAVLPGLFFIGPLVGAICWGCAISATCGMTV